MKFYKLFILLSFCCLFEINVLAQSGDKLVMGEQVVCKIVKTKEPIIVDGQMTEAIWRKTEAIKLDHFYRLEASDVKQQTNFRMAWDDENLYVFFYFVDKYLNAKQMKRDGQPYLDDCGEIFIIPVPDSLDTHFGFELNLYKASNDFVYFNNYYKEKDYVLKAFNPEFSVETSYEGTINNNSDKDVAWSLEMAIPFINFYSLRNPAKNGSKWAFMVVRQDCNAFEDRPSTSTIFPIYDISKGVHQSKHFGLMQFVE